MVGEHKFTEAFLTMALLIILYIPLLWVSLALGPSVCMTATSRRGGSP
jgi:hypothetical protein